MIQNISLSGQKRIAWLLFLIFYSQMVASAHVNLTAANGDGNRYLNTINYSFNSRKIINKNFFADSKSTVNLNYKAGNTFKKKGIKNTKSTNSDLLFSSSGTPLSKNISGPGQPEMQAFQSVNANNMVDLFSGDFSYNIPLFDVGGYPLGISYHSGVTMDQDPSWVGLGWNINPGSIMRNVRGLPDDFNGTEKIKREYNVKKNWTAGLTVGLEPELWGLEIPKINFNPGVFYNSYNGVGFELGATATFNFGKKLISTPKTGPGDTQKMDTSWSSKFSPSLSFAINSQNGLTGNASYLQRFSKNDNVNRGEASIGLNYSSRGGLQSLQLSGQSFTNKVVDHILGAVQPISFAKETYTPTITMPVTNFGFALTLKAGGEFIGFHPLVSLKGYYSQQYIAPGDRTEYLKAYGYMFYKKGNKDDRALLDFNREKDIPFRANTPHAAIPIFTYDTYSISGEGTGGTFRPYRGDAGYVRDHKIITKNASASVGVDLGGGNLVHGGGNIDFNIAFSRAGRWSSGNFLETYTQFLESDSNFEAVYFRNPSEQTTNTTEYFDQIGGDNVVRPALAGPALYPSITPSLLGYDRQKFQSSTNVTSVIKKNKRDKRTQLISYLNSAEAGVVGLDTLIKSYPINYFPKGKYDSGYSKISRNDGNDGIRKPNHISEITVLNGDGKRYVYGIPAYNLLQKEVTFAVDKNNNGSNTTGLVSYTPGLDNSVNNNKGKDNYFSAETTPGHAHSFLLTGLLSPDYVDITGDGITEDDIGDAVKFNYSRMEWNDPNTPTGKTVNFKWRAPFIQNQATYNEGLKSDRTDDKGSYVYGEKEIWYTNSIESKTMIATFTLENFSDTSNSGFAAIDENGGKNSNMGLRRLKKIDLYLKSDYYKNPTTARPVKTVNFEYSYELCVGTPNAANGGQGKLTLKSIWFTYNGNARGIKNKYRFQYHSNNPNYNNKSYDRWGNYKPDTDNPGSLTNAEYPYSTQNKTNEDNNVGAWNLTKITLPSGAKINVDYESDDYGYVQDKRAMNMFKIVKMGATSNYTEGTQNLYSSNGPLSSDYKYVFISVPSPVGSRGEVYQKYLQGVDKIYFRMSVAMPSDANGSGNETVPFYAEYEDYGYASPNIIWVKLRDFGSSQTFPAVAAIQFLRLNLPSKAYPGSDVSGDPGFTAIIKSLVGMTKQVATIAAGFSMDKRKKSICRRFDSSRSFLRLDNPDYKKLGGGLRVKRITISDNWNAMTGLKESTYGQDYDYTTTENISYDSLGTTILRKTKISSGIAGYEPNVGNEENPFRMPVEFNESVTMAPTNYFYTEYPYCEALFPAPGVGYSKVTVSSINKKNFKSFNGWDQTEFFTTRDFPTVTDYTTFDGTSEKRGKINVLNIWNKVRTSISQGFKIELNDMNGKTKSQKTFAATDSVNPIAYTVNVYRTDKDNVHGVRLSTTVPVMDSANGKINPNGTVGKDIELMLDYREHETVSLSVDVNVNVDAFIAGIFPIVVPTVFPKIGLDENKFTSAVAVKVIQRYGILDSVYHYEKGSLLSTHDIVYDSETGASLLNSTQNEFNDPVYSFNYPAHWKYSGMDPAYKNIGDQFSGLNIEGGKIINMDLNPYLESGDELLVVSRSIFSMSPLTGYVCTPGSEYLKSKNVRQLWVIDANKTSPSPGLTNRFYLVDKYGNPYYGKNVTIKIIRSGKRNMPSLSIGSFTTLKNPVSIISTSQWQLNTDSTGVLSAGAGTFKDMWAVDNKFFSTVKCTGGVDASCDSLTKIVNEFKYNFNNTPSSFAYNSDECDTSTWEVLGCPSVTDGTIRFKDFFTEPGIIKLPQSVVDTLPVTKLLYQFIFRQRCITNINGGFTYTIRMKAPSTESISGLSKTVFFGFNTLIGCDNCYFIPYIYFSSGGINYNNSTNYPMAIDLENYHVYKMQFKDQQIKIYIDDILRVSIPFTGTITSLTGSGPQFQYLNGKIDWVKINDYNDKVILDEQFNSGCGTFDIPKPKYRCEVNCQTSFVNFFNSKFNSSFTFPQIDSVYRVNCRHFYDPCLDTTYYVKDTCFTTCESQFTLRFNPYAQGIWGNWRMDKSYVFYDDRKDSDPNSVTNIRRDGELKKWVPYWNFGSPNLVESGYSRWVWNSEITRFNKRGFEIENKDPLGRYNSGLYAYSQSLPVAVAQNAKYRQIAYEGFEDYSYSPDSSGRLCPPQRDLDFSFFINKISAAEKHSGKSSLLLANSDSVTLSVNVVTAGFDTAKTTVSSRINTGLCYKMDSLFTPDVNGIVTPVFSPTQGDSMVIGAWVKESQDCKCNGYVNNRIVITYFNGASQIAASAILLPSGNIIEGWQRYEQVIFIPSAATRLEIKLKNTSPSANNIYFDDFRIHPFNSNMKTFAYSPINLRLMAEMDENNYASFYEYDDEGTLVRVKKETQKGIKTIQETKSVLTKINQ